MNRFNFDCGLPRAGTTLLSALLDQHPDIHASVASPVCKIMQDTILTFSNTDGYTHVDPEGSNYVLENIIQNYYRDNDSPLIIDKSRLWPTEIPLILKYIEPDPKILCAVREPLDIIASFLWLIEDQPESNFIDRYLLAVEAELTTYNRCKALMQPGGMIYDYLEFLKSAFWCEFDCFIMLIEYDDLTSNTEEILNSVLSFLDAPTYQFDLDNIKPKLKEDTDHLAIGLHSVRQEVKKIDRSYKDILPSNIIEEYKDMAFWRQT